uniref:Uncharacterized protein n=1 Tax=Arundo donax TaxID=35708 RepID=A0A0A8XX87_ARUDO
MMSFLLVTKVKTEENCTQQWVEIRLLLSNKGQGQTMSSGMVFFCFFKLLS